MYAVLDCMMQADSGFNRKALAPIGPAGSNVGVAARQEKTIERSSISEPQNDDLLTTGIPEGIPALHGVFSAEALGIRHLWRRGVNAPDSTRKYASAISSGCILTDLIHKTNASADERIRIRLPWYPASRPPIAGRKSVTEFVRSS
jgi:hypothetical protein